MYTKKGVNNIPAIRRNIFAVIYTIKIPPTISRFCSKRMGPGIKPKIKRAPKSIAEDASPGIPKASEGTRVPPTVELLAASVATTPPSAPFPYSSFGLDHALAIA